MARDILIDLGAQWGHVVPLSVLEKIDHIEFHEDGHITVACDGRTFRSRSKFSDEEQEQQKNRLLGFSNGIVSEADYTAIMKSIQAQTGVEIEDVQNDPLVDITYIRRLWAERQGVPFYRFVLTYDPATGQVVVDEDHNGAFHNVITDWCDPSVLEKLNEQEQMLLFAHEVLFRMVEPIIPEPDLPDDPFADIPAMGVRSPRQQIDLGEIIGSDKIIKA